MCKPGDPSRDLLFGLLALQMRVAKLIDVKSAIPEQDR